MSIPFRIIVLGPLDVLDESGASIRPRGRKECALIALLALSQGHRQTRKWLQDKLWSDRGEAQGAASLRQALVQIRSVFRDCSDAILSDRISVGLNPDRFIFDHIDQSEPLPPNVELLQGIDVRDESFDEWLRLERCSFDNIRTIPDVFLRETQTVSRLIFEEPQNSSGADSDRGLVNLLQDELIDAARTLEFNYQIDRRMEPREHRFEFLPKGNDIRVQVKTARAGSSLFLAITVTDWFGAVLWHFREELAPSSNADQMNKVYRLCHAFTYFLIERENRLSREAPEVVGQRFDKSVIYHGLFVPGSVDIETLVCRGNSLLTNEPSGLALALFATIELLRFGEHSTGTSLSPEDTIRQYNKAIRSDPANGIVYALSGHANSFLMKRPSRGLPHTYAAVKLSPGNALCWALHALSLGYANKTEESQAAANISERISKYTLLTPFVESVCCFTSLLNNNFPEAIRFGESSLSILPDFRPTALDLATAYACSEDYVNGRLALRFIRDRDPEVCLEKLKTPEYPIVSEQHRSILMNGLSRL